MAITGNYSAAFGRIVRSVVKRGRQSMAQVVETRELLENEILTEL